MRAIFMGKKKDSVFKALNNVINLGVEIVAVVVPPKDKQSFECFGLPVCSDDDIYKYLEGTKKADFNFESIDIVVSFLFPKKIKKPLINLARIGCINFHSAPLPNYRGWGVYNAAILNGEKNWGVSAHFVDEDFDTGDIIQVDSFDIDVEKETAFSLERRSQNALLKLFDKVMNMVISGKLLPRKNQEKNAGKTYTKQETLKHEIINLNDSTEIINKKIRAFWYPPFGAQIVLNGEKYFLVNSAIMDDIKKIS